MTTRNFQMPDAPVRQSPRLSPLQEEAFDGLLLAMLARKRVLVLIGPDRPTRLAVLGTMVEHVEADGTLVLTVTARSGSEVEDLIAAGAIAAGVPEDGDFDALIGSMEQRLDMAGAGLLAVDDAQLLELGVLSDLIDLSLSESPGGKFLQVLLCGGPELERRLAVPAIAAAFAEIGVIHRLTPGARCSTTPEPADTVAPERPDAAAEPEPAPEKSTGNRRAMGPALAAGLLLAIGVAGATAYLSGIPPESPAGGLRSPTAPPVKQIAPARPNAAAAGSSATPAAQGTGGGGSTARPMPEPAKGAPPAETPPPPGPASVPPPPAAKPPELASLPPPAGRSDPAAAPAERAPAGSIGGGSAGAGIPDPELRERLATLAEQGRRHIAAKRLTTPAGSNALEIVRAMRAFAPNAPEADALAAEIVATYRRWATQAERDGNRADAQRFLERALAVDPGDAEVLNRLRAAEPQFRPGEGAADPAPGAEPDAALSTPAAAVALLEQPDTLRTVLTGGLPPDRTLPDGRTLLMLAAERGLAPAARLLLERGASANARSADGATPLMYAAWYGQSALVSLLGAAGADPDTRNQDGRTALMLAASRGNAAAVAALLERGASVEATTGQGWTALMYASDAGHEAVARTLVAHGADPYRTDARGNSAYTLGAAQGHREVVEALRGR